MTEANREDLLKRRPAGGAEPCARTGSPGIGGGLKERVLVIARHLEDEAAAENAEKRRR